MRLVSKIQAKFCTLLTPYKIREGLTKFTSEFYKFTYDQSSGILLI